MTTKTTITRAALRALVDAARRRVREARGVMRYGDPNVRTVCGSCRNGGPCGGRCER